MTLEVSAKPGDDNQDKNTHPLTVRWHAEQPQIGLPHSARWQRWVAGVLSSATGVWYSLHSQPVWSSIESFAQLLR